MTGLGVISPMGNSPVELHANLIGGKSAVRRLAPTLASRLKSPIGAPAELDATSYFDPPRLRMLDRVSQFALLATAQAVADAGIDFSRERLERCGVYVGSGMGGATTTDEGYQALYADASDRIKPYTVLAAMTNAAASWIGIEYAITGPNLTFSTACSSSAVAIGEAALRIASGSVDVMIAGGTEAPLTYGVLRAWEAMRTLAGEDPRDSAASCKPFSLNRSGLVLGEGAAFVILEDWEHAAARGATIYAELSGYGLTSDAAHITRPTVEGQAGAMRAALIAAGLSTTAIGYINAHGTATLQNDAIETAAIKAVFGELAYRVPISSTKSMHGHLLGAAGALEFVIAILCLRDYVLPPTMHLDVADPACDLDYIATGSRPVNAFQAAMSNSFAFGGTNAVLIAQKYGADSWS